MLLQLFAPMVLVIFHNPSIRKLVFHRSRGINFNTFCACFFDFILSVIFDKVFSTFEAMLVSIWHHFSEKKMYRKWLRKKGPLTSKQQTMNMSRGSQRSRLACALLKQETTVRAQISNNAARAHVLVLENAVLICFHCIFFQKCSKN